MGILKSKGEGSFYSIEEINNMFKHTRIISGTSIHNETTIIKLDIEQGESAIIINSRTGIAGIGSRTITYADALSSVTIPNGGIGLAKNANSDLLTITGHSTYDFTYFIIINKKG